MFFFELYAINVLHYYTEVSNLVDTMMMFVHVIFIVTITQWKVFKQANQFLLTTYKKEFSAFKIYSKYFNYNSLFNNLKLFTFVLLALCSFN